MSTQICFDVMLRPGLELRLTDARKRTYHAFHTREQRPQVRFYGDIIRYDSGHGARYDSTELEDDALEHPLPVIARYDFFSEGVRYIIFGDQIQQLHMRTIGRS